MNKVIAWAEKHPYYTAGIVVGVGLLVLWWLGVFSSKPAAASQGANLAGAYYAAETAQTQAGTALAIAQSQNNAAVAGARIQADAATAIMTTQASRDVLLGSQQAGTDQLAIQTSGVTNLAGIAGDVTKAGYTAQTAQSGQAYAYQTTHDVAAYADQTARALSDNNLNATNTANAYAAQTAQHSRDVDLIYGQSHDNAMLGLAYEQTVIPAQLATQTTQQGRLWDFASLMAQLSPGKTQTIDSPAGNIGYGAFAQPPNTMAAMGFSPAQIAAFWGPS